MTRSHVNALVRFLLVFVITAGAVCAGATDEIVVSPDGNDAARGTAQEPVATPFQAQRLARQSLAQGHAVTVIFKAGTYRLDRPLVFTPEDSGTDQSPVVWQAAPDQAVTFSGGQLLKLRWEPYRDGIFKAQVPDGFRRRPIVRQRRASAHGAISELRPGSAHHERLRRRLHQSRSASPDGPIRPADTSTRCTRISGATTTTASPARTPTAP